MLESLDWFAVLIHQKDFKIPSYILGSVLTRKTVFQEGVNLSSIGTVDISLFEKDELIFCSIEVGLGCKLTNLIMSSLKIPVLMLERILPRKSDFRTRNSPVLELQTDCTERRGPRSLYHEIRRAVGRVAYSLILCSHRPKLRSRNKESCLESWTWRQSRPSYLYR